MCSSGSIVKRGLRRVERGSHAKTDGMHPKISCPAPLSYIADEIVRLLRKIRGKEVADKFFNRVLRLIKEPQLNLIAKKHNIDKSLSIDAKIKEILNVGVSFTNALPNILQRRFQ